MMTVLAETNNVDDDEVPGLLTAVRLETRKETGSSWCEEGVIFDFIL